MCGFVQQAQNHVLEIPGDTGNNKIQVIVHKKIRMLPDGRPLLQVSPDTHYMSVFADDFSHVTRILGALSQFEDCEYCEGSREGKYRWLICESLSVCAGLICG